MEGQKKVLDSCPRSESGQAPAGMKQGENHEWRIWLVIGFFHTNNGASQSANGYAEVPVRRAIVADAAFLTVPIVAGQN